MKKEQLKSLVGLVIKQGFPELLGEDIRVEFKSELDNLIEIGGLEDEGWFIEIDSSLKNLDESILIGGIAHELSHIIRDKRETWFEKLLYATSARYREATERDVDVVVIIRGYGRELLEFTKHSCQDWDHYKEDGLSVRELEILTK